MSGASSPAPIAGSRTSVLRRMYRPSFAPVAPLRPGEVLAGKYRIEALLGQGGMGAVYRASRARDGAFVAVKVMRSEHASDASMAERFRREAEVVRGIDSARISAVHEFGQTPDGTLFLAMELLRGMSLTAHLESEILLPWREAVRIAREVALGLDAVHGAGVIHRDLKPDNIYVCDGGAIKILDFGIAKEYGSDWASGQIKGKPLTQAGIVVGTPLYMSPEAVTQSPMGPPTDLYALGAVLFEMLTGRLLFEEPEPVLLMGHQLRTRPERVRAVGGDPDIPPALDALVDQLLAKEPKRRPASARAVADALEQITASAPRVPGPARAAAAPAKPRRPEALVPTQITAPDESGPASQPPERTWHEDSTTIDPVQEPATTPRPARAVEAALTVSELDPPAGPDTTPTSALPRARWLGAAAVALVVVGLALSATLGGTAPTATGTALPIDPVVVPTTAVPTVVPPTVAAPATVAPPTVPSTVAPSLATIRFEIVPADARVSEDGVAVAGGAVRVPRDGAEHVFAIEARGRAPQRVRVAADEDHIVRVTLRPRTESAAEPPSSSTHGGDIAREF